MGGHEHRRRTRVIDLITRWLGLATLVGIALVSLSSVGDPWDRDAAHPKRIRLAPPSPSSLVPSSVHGVYELPSSRFAQAGDTRGVELVDREALSLVSTWNPFEQHSLPSWQAESHIESILGSWPAPSTDRVPWLPNEEGPVIEELPDVELVLTGPAGPTLREQVHDEARQVAAPLILADSQSPAIFALLALVRDRYRGAWLGVQDPSGRTARHPLFFGMPASPLPLGNVATISIRSHELRIHLHSGLQGRGPASCRIPHRSDDTVHLRELSAIVEEGLTDPGLEPRALIELLDDELTTGEFVAVLDTLFAAGVRSLDVTPPGGWPRIQMDELEAESFMAVQGVADDVARPYEPPTCAERQEIELSRFPSPETWVQRVQAAVSDCSFSSPPTVDHPSSLRRPVSVRIGARGWVTTVVPLPTPAPELEQCLLHAFQLNRLAPTGRDYQRSVTLTLGESGLLRPELVFDHADP